MAWLTWNFMKNFKDKKSGSFDYSQLQSTLVNSGLQTENPALYNVVTKLILAAHDFQGQSNDSVKSGDLIDLSKQVSGMLSPANGGIFNGSYVPVLTPIANIATSVTYYTRFSVSDRLVVVSGKLNIKASAANVLTEAELELPIHVNFQFPDQLQGIINGIPLDGSTEGFPGILSGDTITGQAKLSYYPKNTDNHDIRFMFSY